MAMHAPAEVFTASCHGPVWVREATNRDKECFDHFVDTHPSGSVLQSWAWGELRRHQHWTAIRLLAENRAGNVCGAASVLCRSLPAGGSVLYLPRGPVLDFRDPLVLDRMTDALRRLGERHHAVLCKVDPYVTPPDASVRRALLLRGYTVGHRRGRFDGMQPRFNIVVPLDGGPEAVLARCHHKTRYNIRLASKRGVTVERGDRRDLSIFHRLLMITCARDGFRERTLPYFQQVWDALSPDDRVELHLARYQGQVLAAAILLVGGRKAVYAYGASANEHRELMASYALQWAMISRACARDCCSYDMTGIPKHLQEGMPGHGLYRFKRGFWPEVSEFTGEWDLPLHPGLYRLWNIVEPTYWGSQVFVRRAIQAIRPGLGIAGAGREEP